MMLQHVSPRPFFLLPFVFIVLGIIFVGFGVYFLLKAVWDLRQGQYERRFVIRAMIGLALIFLPWVFAGLAGMMAFNAQPAQMSSSSSSGSTTSVVQGQSNGLLNATTVG